MRTTLTLDDDIAAKLKAVTRRTGKSFREVINEMLRRALNDKPPAGKRFKVIPRDLGLRPGLSLDCVWETLERVEGPNPR